MADGRWFHVIVSTYGSWLYGDPRGFRTRHHREHVEGDYRSPPPAGLYEAKHRRSQASLKQPPVTFPREWRCVVGEAFRDRLRQEGAEVIVVAVGGQHVHAQVKMPAFQTRHWVGLAKRHVTFVLHAQGWKGLVWAVRSKEKPIEDRAHQLNVFEYIRKHARQGAWVWTFRDDAPPPKAQG
jgi:hypothetical protein